MFTGFREGAPKMGRQESAVLAVLVLFVSIHMGECCINTKNIFDRLIQTEALLRGMVQNVTNLILEDRLGTTEKLCPKSTCVPECQTGEVCIDLDQTGVTRGSIAGFSTVVSQSNLVAGKPCSRQGVFKITFIPNATQANEECRNDITTPDTQVLIPQKMLKIQMFYSNGERSGWTFNIGDSESNNGWAGDGNHQFYDAEAQGLENGINVYSNDKCGSGNLYNLPDSLNPPTSVVNAYVKNYFLRFSNDNGLVNNNCSACLYGLNGQADTNQNSDIYFAANRVVSTAGRSGVGLCFVKMRWVSGINQ